MANAEGLWVTHCLHCGQEIEETVWRMPDGSLRDGWWSPPQGGPDDEEAWVCKDAPLGIHEEA